MLNHCYDYHVHTSMSADCETSIKEQVARAAELGLEEICLTEHLEINFPSPKDFRLDLKQYLEAYRGISFNGVRVKLGVEAGTTSNAEDFAALEADLREVSLDYILASCHLVDGLDPYYSEFFIGKSIEEAFSQYIATVYQNLKRMDPALFSAVAHIDFPSKGSHNYPDPRLRYAYASDELDELFRYVISLGKCIEINTSAYRRLGEMPIPGLDWLTRYVELGGEYVTIGSDSHTPKHLGFRLDDASELARRAGVKYVATFDQMKPVFHKL